MKDNCGKCKHFGAHGEPHVHRFESGYNYGWIHHCEFDEKKVNSNGEPCEKYVNQLEDYHAQQLAKMAVADKYIDKDGTPLQQAEMF